MAKADELMRAQMAMIQLADALEAVIGLTDTSVTLNRRVVTTLDKGVSIDPGMRDAISRSTTTIEKALEVARVNTARIRSEMFPGAPPDAD